MSIVPRYARFPRLLDEMFSDFGRFDMQPYWLTSGDSTNVGNTLSEVTNDATKFEVDIDVSHFKPEELKVNLDGNVLTIEGNHELKTGDSYMKRSFTRKWSLPSDCDLSAVRSSLSDKGHLTIEAPKTGASASRAIPIDRK